MGITQELQKIVKVSGMWNVPNTKFYKTIIESINHLRTKCTETDSAIEAVFENPDQVTVFGFDVTKLERDMVVFLREFNGMEGYVNRINTPGTQGAALRNAEGVIATPPETQTVTDDMDEVVDDEEGEEEDEEGMDGTYAVADDETIEDADDLFDLPDPVMIPDID